MIIKDQLHREIIISKPLSRIVSLVPSQTELLVDLGLEEKIVGVTKFCVHPAHIRKTKKVVGGTKKVHYNKIKELEPDIILCNKEENTEEMVLELEKIAPVHVSNVIDIPDTLELIGQYGELFDRKEKSKVLLQNLRLKIEKFTSQPRPQLKVAYFIWRKPWMLAGENTFINTLLELNGWKNVAQTKKGRYPEIDLKELEVLKPDLILLSSEPFPFKEKHFKEIREHYGGRITLVDGEYFSWYGSRLEPAISYFRKFQMKLSNFL